MKSIKTAMSFVFHMIMMLQPNQLVENKCKKVQIKQFSFEGEGISSILEKILHPSCENTNDGPAKQLHIAESHPMKRDRIW